MDEKDLEGVSGGKSVPGIDSVRVETVCADCGAPLDDTTIMTAFQSSLSGRTR